MILRAIRLSVYPRLQTSIVLAVLTTTFQYATFAAPEPAGELIIRYRSGASTAALANGISNARLHLHRYIRTRPMARKGQIGLVKATTDLHTEAAIQILRQDPAVEHVERNVYFHGQETSNDPYFSATIAPNLWGMYGDASTPSNQYGSQAAEAWAAGYAGSSSVCVAILDDGIQLDHPDLAGNIWSNPFETANALDDDGNGKADDLNGWNFVDGDNVIFHGTNDLHASLVAGVIGGIGGNGVGVAGINWDVSLIPLRMLSNGDGDTLDAVAAMDYCVEMKGNGVNIVAMNASWGSSEYSLEVHEAAIRAAKAGILLIAAAGNAPEGDPAGDNDATPFWPANIDTTIPAGLETAASYNSVISVAAIDKTGGLAAFSNYGSTTVHLGAPGVDIVSTYPTNAYASANGTSLATPFVTGAVALYASTHPYASPEEIRSAILAAATPTASLAGKTQTGGRLDLSSLINPATIVGRNLFYNQSAWDGNSAAASASDDAAIATDKTALLPGGTATFANYSSYSRGINGIMIDIANIGDAATLSASDFTFKVGNNNTPSGWATAPAPTSISVRAGAGAGGSTRVTVIWANNAIQKQWLQVTLLSSRSTGLMTPDVFYFGNAIGEVGNSSLNTNVDASDQLLTRDNFRSILNPAPIDFAYDFNRDKKVDASDQLFARINFTSVLTRLKLISI